MDRQDVPRRRGAHARRHARVRRATTEGPLRLLRLAPMLALLACQKAPPIATTPETRPVPVDPTVVDPPRVYDCAEGEIVVGVAGASRADCRRGDRAAAIERAMLAGAFVWAVGNEPGWKLVLYPEKFELVTDYGEHELAGASHRVASEADEVLRFEGTSDDHVVRIDLVRGPCQDAMSGAPFDTIVTVVRDGATYRGCGKWLEGGVNESGACGRGAPPPSSLPPSE